jgi:NitT/TauT family transport system substrate-binding protein
MFNRKPATMLAAAVAGTILLAGCGSSGEEGNASGDGPISMQIGRAPAFAQFPLFVADEEGFWEDGGIEAEFVSIAAGPEQTAAQVAGELDVVDNVPNNLLPIIDKGVDLVAFTQVFKASQFDIIVDADYPLTAEQGDWEGVMQDLEGAKVGVIARGTGAEDIARTLFEEAGVDPESAAYIATGLPATTLAAMENDQIDMAITLEPGIASAVDSGLAVAPFSVRAEEAPESLIWPGVVGTVTREYAEANPEALEAYVGVLEETMAFIRDPENKDRVIELMETTLSVPSDVATYLYDNNLDDWGDAVPLTPETVEQLDTAATWVNDIGKVATAHPAEEWTLVLE